MIIDVLRHGEVDGPNCFRGRTDTHLSEHGWQQLEKATALLKPDLIVSSPLQRCQNFAMQWGQQLNIRTEIEADFSEMDFGEWDGKTVDEIQQSNAEMLYAFWSDPASVTPPGAESYSDFSKRITNGLRKLAEQQAQHIVVLTHGGVIKALLALILEIPAQNLLSIETPLASRSRIRVSQHEEQFYFSLIQHGICS